MSDEHAAGDRGPTRSSTFPNRWGTPPLDAVERAHWVAVHVRGANALLPGVEVRQPMTAADALARLVLLDLRGRIAWLDARRNGPA